MDFLALYSEAGMIGVVGAMFVFMVYSMNKRGNEQAQALENLKIEKVKFIGLLNNGYMI